MNFNNSTIEDNIMIYVSIKVHRNIYFKYFDIYTFLDFVLFIGLNWTSDTRITNYIVELLNFTYLKTETNDNKYHLILIMNMFYVK